ncbi:MAG: TatD family hydrolase [Chitinophagaceae bacterium]
MNLIDTHSHIYLPEFDKDRVLMLERAEKEGVIKILMPAIDSKTHEKMLSGEMEHQPSCFSMMGVHPCSIRENYKDELKMAGEFFEKRNFKAVGETGLDFYWDKTFTLQQYAAFHQQIEWALQYEIPVVIHSRNSTDECIKVVSEHQKGKLTGVFHCFSGNETQAAQVIDLGFYLGIGGVITFKNGGLDKVMEHISLEHVVLETDAPYLAPVPFRGKRNEPSYLKYIAAKLAEIKGVDLEEIGTITTANAEKLFNL